LILLARLISWFVFAYVVRSGFLLSIEVDKKTVEAEESMKKLTVIRSLSIY
jgi:hypothetical protein